MSTLCAQTSTDTAADHDRCFCHEPAGHHGPHRCGYVYCLRPFERSTQDEQRVAKRTAVATDIADAVMDSRFDTELSEWWGVLEYGPALAHLADRIADTLIAEGHVPT